jgi:ABC-type glycerol-3-phosphate transport system permease component
MMAEAIPRGGPLQWGWLITLTILPAIIMFLLAQRYIVAGLTAGAVKG